ncbi:glycosyltransferase family 2 protein [Luteimonas lutimaris]|uniref:Glycosyltransferase n=1 Tax=Luteimonas lutimaris TaxID=698645 RepID=A0ABP7M7Y5_9GAMM
MISIIVPVFRNAGSALELVRLLRLQELPNDSTLEIIMVDDGSGDDSTSRLQQHEDEHVRLIALPRNMGRSAARNAGAYHAQGKFLVFIDCDCRPEGQRFLSTHLEVLRGGCVASLGPVVAPEGDDAFWSRYQNEASARRARQHARGIFYSGSTANFAVHADAYRQCNGFDPRYIAYGFEDRDLLVRLSHMGRLGWCPEARITHLDALTLPGVLEKMRTAAGTSAELFSHDHLEAYRSLGYAELDVRLHPWLSPIATLTKPLLGAAPVVDRLLGQPWIPYRLFKPIVKALVAIAYMQGTTLASPGPAPRAT